MADQEPTKKDPKDHKKEGPKQGGTILQAAINSPEFWDSLDRVNPGLGNLLKQILSPFTKLAENQKVHEEQKKDPQQAANEAKAGEDIKNKFSSVFADKDGLNPAVLSAEVSKGLQKMEAEGKITFPSAAARREFMNDVANAPYRAEKDKMVAEVAETAVAAAKKYGVTIDMGHGVDHKVAPTSLDSNRAVSLTPQELVDITPKDSGGWMNAYKVGPDGHMVEQGNMKTADVMAGIGNNPTITLLKDKGPAVDTQELVGHDDVPGGAFAALKGDNGMVYYTDIQSLPGLGGDKGKNIWSKMQVEEQDPSATGPSLGMGLNAGVKNQAAPGMSVQI